MRSLALVPLVLALAGCGGEDARETPPPPPTTGAAAIGPGISIEKALAAPSDEPLLVRGHLLARDGDVRLCSALAESDPPQCADPSLRVEGLDLETVEGTNTANGVTWTDEEIKLLGRVEDRTLTVSDTAMA